MNTDGDRELKRNLLNAKCCSLYPRYVKKGQFPGSFNTAVLIEPWIHTEERKPRSLVCAVEPPGSRHHLENGFPRDQTSRKWTLG